MITLQEKVEALLQEYVSWWPGWSTNELQIIASHRYSNIGTYHILDAEDDHIRSVNFGFQENRVEFSEGDGLIAGIAFNIPEDWDKLRKYLKELVKPRE